MNSSKRNLLNDSVWKQLAVGLTILVLCMAAGTVSYAIWGGAGNNYGLALAACFAVAALLSPRLWTAVWWLPLVIVGLILGLFGLSVLTNILPFSVLLADVLIALLSAWLVLLLIRHKSVPSMKAGSTAGQMGPINPIDQFEHAFQLELIRSRRHERSFCFAIIKFGLPINEIETVSFRRLSRELRNSLRWIDHIYFGAVADELLLICPETNLNGISQLAKRLRELIEAAAPQNFKIVWAEFPADAITSQELKAEARRKLSQTNVSVLSEKSDARTLETQEKQTQ